MFFFLFFVFFLFFLLFFFVFFFFFFFFFCLFVFCLFVVVVFSKKAKITKFSLSVSNTQFQCDFAAYEFSMIYNKLENGIKHKKI